MDRSDSISSTASTASKSSTSSTGAFAYQTRLLERTASGRVPGSPTRSNSGTARTIFTSPTSPGTPSFTRKWTPSHRVGTSVDATRSKWEERVRDAAAEASIPSSPTKTFDSLKRTDTDPDITQEEYRPATPPTNIRRHTVILPPGASPTPSNSKVNDVFNDHTSSPRDNIHTTYLRKADTPSSFPSSPSNAAYPLTHRPNRAGSVDSWKPSASVPASPTVPSPTKDTVDPETPTKTPIRRRPISLHSPFLERGSSPTKIERPLYGSSSPSISSEKLVGTSHSPQTNVPSSNPMTPTTYRSGYMSKKGNISEQLGSKRRLGNHLPRIASGDSEPPELLLKQEPVEKDLPRSGRQPLRDRQPRTNLLESRSPEKLKAREYLDGKIPDGDDVVGLPGRIQLKAPTPPGPDAPRPSYRYGLWADRQRHLIQAYEYLCHVGEAQQWIEGCLDEELGFGVVEMEDGLRNGVVLAKLVRAFEPNAVRRIYDAPKLDFRHSDNINVFFNFVRNVGLPEGFIFELTDLYDKKNIPKVIYCIHALSHLMARRGLAQRIGNLLGRLEFTDDQLQKTQKGLKDSGVAMPNFGNVRNELAKEINEPPEEEEETEEERQRRELSECEGSIAALQNAARGFLVRKQQAVFQGRLRLAERGVQKLQARLRGALLRRQIRSQRENIMSMSRWATKIQAHARGVLVRRRWRVRLGLIRASTGAIVKLQAQARGYLQRRRYQFLKAALKRSKMAVVKLQSIARAKVARNQHEQLSKSFSKRDITSAIVKFQALARGILFRRRYAALIRYFQQRHRRYAGLQAHCRGMQLRRRMRTQLARLEDASNVVIKIQAAVRTYLARKRLLSLIRGLRKATPMIIALQTRARAQTSSQKHQHLRKALSQISVKKSVGVFQQLARAKLAQNKHQELKRSLDIVSPDTKGLQATCRGYLVRKEWYAWRDHVRQSEDIAIYLQALLRGAMVRKAHKQRIEYYRQNLNKVVKIQSLFRAKETREQYRQLTLGTNVSVGTIKNFVHLLDDSEADFQEEIKVERLRKRVVESIRENQALENEVNDLDVKIALVVQNAKSFEDIIKTRRHHGSLLSTNGSILAAHGDPFSPHALEQGARRKLELYQQLFYLLQTKAEYLSSLFVRFMSQEIPEKNRRFLERVVLALFGYGQDRREDYLLLKLFQLAISDEISSANSVESIIRGHPLYINIAVHYMRPKQSAFVRDAFQSIIKEVINSDDLDLEADPALIHRARVELDEMRTGAPSRKPKDVTFHEAIHDTETRAVYIRHLQLLQWWVQAFVTAICQSTRKMPYSMRYLARETLANLKEQFPNEPPEVHAICLSRLVYYRFINPAIIAPETFDIVSDTIDLVSRKNLAQISKILTQITSGRTFTEDEPAYLPINDYITKAITELTTWLLEVADVADAETQFRASEFLDATVQPKPIYISPNEIYTMHGLLSQNLNAIAPEPEDTLRVIINELDGVPHAGSEELTKARDAAITLDLTNRFAHVQDPHAEEKTLWVQAKRGVLAILRVQPAQGLLESLMRPVTSQDEQVWEDILQAEMEAEARKMNQINRRQPSAFAADAAYRLEDIRSLKFAAVKALAISNLLELESQGKISREDGFQGILNAIAGDVRSKHRKRLQRQQEMQRMHEALQELAERKRYFEEQIDSYHNYVETSMATMQRGKGKKRFVIPFTKQYFHLRDLQKSGRNPQFGSYVYSAKYLYEKGILLSIDQHSPRQFDKINLTMSSNAAGVFNLVLDSDLMGFTKPLGSDDIRMGDLLQAKYEQKSSLALFGGKVNFNLELLLFQINKKFYAS